MAYGYNKLPQLKWVKSITSTTILPKFITDISEDRFLCADSKKIVVINADDGTVAATIPGFSSLASIAKAGDENYVLSDGNKITLLNSSLETVWSKPILNNLTIAAVIQTSDSGFAAIGNVADSTRIIKTNKNCDTLWTRTVSNNCTVRSGTRIVEVDGGYITGGICCVEPCIWMDGWISKYNYTGNEEWTKVITGLTMYDMIPVSNGVVLTGMMDLDAESPQDTVQPAGLAKLLRFPATNIPFIHFGADGAPLLQTGFGGLPGRNWGNTVRELEDTFIFACYMSSYQNPLLCRVIVFTTDKVGKTTWSHQYNLSDISPDRPVAQPLPSGALVVLASDSLYYYSDPTGSNKGANTALRGKPLNSSTINLIQNRLSFTLGKTSNVQLTLYSVDGKIVYHYAEALLPEGRHYLTPLGIAPGAYMVRLLCNGQGKVQKYVFFR